MKNKYKFIFYHVISLLCFIAMSSFLKASNSPKPSSFLKASNSPKPSSKDSSIMLAYGDGHHGHHGRHGHHWWGRGRSGIEFRFDLSPPRRYYYDDTFYYRSIPLYCEVYDDGKTQVTEVEIANNVVAPTVNGSTYTFSLRPGYYTIRWRVKNDTVFGDTYRNYTRTIAVNRGLSQIYVKIRGTNISVNYIGY